MSEENSGKRKLSGTYLLLAVLLLSFTVLFAARYLTVHIERLFIDVAFGIAAATVSVVAYLFVRNINRAAKLHDALVLREELLRETLNSLEEGVITTDINGRITGMNPSAEHLTAWNEDDALGALLEQVYDVVNEATGKHFEHVVKRILREGRTVTFENNTVLHTKDRRQIIISNNGSPIKDVAGKMVGAVLVFRDITEKKMLNEEKKVLTNRLLLAVKSAGMGIWELDLKSNKLVWDEQMYRLYEPDGLPQDISHAIWEHRMHPDDKQRIIDEIEQVQESGEEYNSEFRIVDDDGNVRYLKATGLLNRDSNGKAVSMIGANRDITESKRAQIELNRSEAFSRGVLESLSSHIAVVNEAGVIVASNDAWKRFARENVDVDEKTMMPGANYFGVFEALSATGDVGALDALAGMKKVLEGKIQCFQLESPRHAPDRQRWFNMRVVKFQSDDVMIVVSHENITAVKMAVHAREEITYDLVQRNKRMEQFSQIVSHNLRAPVANILGLASLVKMNALDKDEIPAAVAGMADAAEKLDEVVKDLNDILRVKSRTAEGREAVFFHDIVSEIAEGIDSDIKSHNVVIHTDFVGADKLYSVKKYLQSIFYNLISNSIKYRRPGTEPMIELKSRGTAKSVQLIFRDNGLGIDLERNRNKIFGPYARFHFHTEGKGIGLFMVKSQVEMLGGKIEVNSTVDVGTEFIIEFQHSEN